MTSMLQKCIKAKQYILYINKKEDSITDEMKCNPLFIFLKIFCLYTFCDISFLTFPTTPFVYCKLLLTKSLTNSLNLKKASLASGNIVKYILYVVL